MQDRRDAAVKAGACVLAVLSGSAPVGTLRRDLADERHPASATSTGDGDLDG